jgi:hypothetical protein
MARTMVEDVHGVKPLPVIAAPRSCRNARPLNDIRPGGLGVSANAANRMRRDSEFLIRLWGLTQP